MAKLAKQIEKRMTPTNPIWKRTIPFCRYNIYWWAYPVGVIVALIDMAHNHWYDSMKWSEARAKKMADRYFGKVCDIDEEGLWLCAQWGDYCFAHHAHWWDRAWLARYGYQMKQYIFDTYEIEGYEKEINSLYDEKWVLFSKIGA
jgi:hypothetical protein